MRNIVGLLLVLIIFNDLPCSVTAEHDDDEEEEPSPNQGCMNSETAFFVPIRIDKEWVQVMMGCEEAEQDNNICISLHGFKRNCPITCNSCPDTCEDQQSPVGIKGEDLECSDARAVQYCEKWRFAHHCPVTCNFCPSLAPTVSPAPTPVYGFVKIDEEGGSHRRGYLGHSIAMASHGQKTFVAELNRDSVISSVDILEYSGSKKMLLEDVVANLDQVSRATQMEVSSNGENIIMTFELDKKGMVEVYRLDGSIWRLRRIFSSSLDTDFTFGRALDISADGNTILIASKSSVLVFDFNTKSFRADFPYDAMGDVAHASMTQDGKFVAVSKSTPSSSITVYEWSNNGDWNQCGGNILSLISSAKGRYGVVKIVDGGRTLFASTTEMFGYRGAVRVFDLRVIGRSKVWNLREEGNGFVIKGKKRADTLGRDLSISRDGKFVAWASKSKAGVLRWTGSEWQDEGILVKSKMARVALDPDGLHLVLGLPFETANDKYGAGVISLYHWYFDTPEPTMYRSQS